MSTDDTALAATTPSASIPTQATITGRAKTAPAERESLLEIGERFGGRYTVLGFLGEGGMGSVYRAVDEKLGVDVALKVVRGAARVDGLRDEVRLAQRVTHPNVCRVYDLEDIGGVLLVKMEFVDGETVAARLAAHGTLAIDEAVRIARGIGAGLQAAHDQGIVHRDLKPGNVMLAGERVVLMDFGIASQLDQANGSAAGTLGYMAPEQIANTGVDARADLYALGCVLYEMLVGERVFTAPNAVELGARHVSLAAPDVRDKRPDTPRWLARAVARLLAKDPAARVDGALALRAGPRRARRFALPIAAIVVAGGATALAAHSSRAAEPCTGIEQRLVGVWDDHARAAIHAAFAKTQLPYAERSFTAVATGFDRYAGAWTAAVTESCRATHVRGEQPAEVFALRAACFDTQLAGLRALVGAFGDADAALVQHSETLIAEADSLERCANVVALREVGQPPVPIAAAVASVERGVAEANVQVIAGHAMAALVASQKLLDDALALRWDPTIAAAARTRATALVMTGNLEDALAMYERALWAAMRGRRDDLVIQIAASIASTLAKGVGRPRDAELWVGLANAAAVRFGPNARLDEVRYSLEAMVMAERGDLGAAIALDEKASAIRDQASMPPIVIASHEVQFGITLAKANACPQSIAHLERGLATLASNFGDDYPDVIVIQSNLGLCYHHLGELAKAHDVLAHSLATRERLYGKTSPVLVAPLDNLAEVLADEGDRDAAIAMAARARELAAVVPGTAHQDYHQVATDEAKILVGANRLAEAHARFDDTLRLERASSSPILPKTQTARANLALVEHNWAEATAFATDAIAGFEAQGGADHPALWEPLTALAQAKLALHQDAAARPLLERALANARHAQVSERDLQPTRDALARVADATKPR